MKKKNHTHCTDAKIDRSVFRLHNPTPYVRRSVKRSQLLHVGAQWTGIWILEKSVWEGARPVEEGQEEGANFPLGGADLGRGETLGRGPASRSPTREKHGEGCSTGARSGSQVPHPRGHPDPETVS